VGSSYRFGVSAAEAQGVISGRFSLIFRPATMQAELCNALGQVVRRQAAALPATGATLRVPTGGLAAGVYVLRLQAGAATIARRVVVQ
jgi:hypothetical protein